MTPPPAVQAVLVVAHPAHELRIWRWVEIARPLLAVLTTGSRSGADRRRLERTAELAAGAGAPLSSVFGPVLDRELYAQVQAGEAGPIHGWVSALCQEMVARGARLVVVDAWQGYSVAHDLAHLVGRIAAAEAQLRLGHPVEVVEFAPVSTALAPRLGEAEARYGLTLDAEAAARKALLARDYPDVAAELAELIALDGEASLSEERFHGPAPLDTLLGPPAAKPYYERVGEERVAAGVYKSVLRWNDLKPVLDSLRERAMAVSALSPEAAPTSHPVI